MSKFDINVHLRVSSKQYEDYKKLASRMGVSVAWVIRHATQKYLLEMKSKGVINND